ncbi:type I-C CRISPR-associated endonuclease Cas1c [Pseudodesulfovibrio thermohalotolerans]|uniref:type I-C CRISPR-associated endonuclease Cas1c n=1 Tax=Pseudodesulfovibrio thermohalotolerans TaxID=2880651 RepID=UPI002443290D|nr:type I-C CRISPR-associated endonuclease Cas1c [Pseudodesulfovibrio thermohalotolerans]WFS63349.1 type I-C CRISPR-associated endonuclease Cas1c [Pseudodesulfovibrio thermohalotolerans]
MKKLLNTLYVTSQGTYLSKDGECVVVRAEDGVKRRFPVHVLDGIVCFGNVLCSPFLLGHCGEKGLAVSFLTERGRYLAGVRGPQSGNVLLRRAQYRLADEAEASSRLARAIIAGKIANSRAVLRRCLRDHRNRVDALAMNGAISMLDACAERLRHPVSLDEARGMEGQAANAYFAVFDNLILAEDRTFHFEGRNRRPPLDAVNCLLSFVYTLLAHDVRSALEAVGLDPQVGFLHRDRPGRPGLALDIMEEFRPFLADRLVLSLINRGEVRARGFVSKESGAVFMDEDTRKTVLTAWQKRKQEEVAHPFLKERISLGLAFHVQAQLMARAIRNDLDGYPPYFWR